MSGEVVRLKSSKNQEEKHQTSKWRAQYGMVLIGNLKLGASLEPGFCSFDQGICAREAKKSDSLTALGLSITMIISNGNQSREISSTFCSGSGRCLKALRINQQLQDVPARTDMASLTSFLSKVFL